MTGTLPAGEVFNTSFWVEPSAIGSDMPATNAACADVLTALVALTQWGAWLTALKAGWNTATAATAVTLYSYPAGGNVAAAAASQSISGQVGSVATALPNQISRVLTMRTGQIGRSFRGRMYIPATGESISGGTGHFTGSGQSQCDATAALFTAIPNATLLADGNGLLAIVASHTTGARTPILQVASDNFPDVQRRRENRVTGRVVVTANVT